MLYVDGTTAQLYDRVKMGEDGDCIVVADLDHSVYSPEFPEADWSYLGGGILIESPGYNAVFHLTDPEECILVSRGAHRPIGRTTGL
jgi:hypothetical protein